MVKMVVGYAMLRHAAINTYASTHEPDYLFMRDGGEEEERRG